MNAEIIKAWLMKQLGMGFSREFELAVIGLGVILFGADLGLPVKEPISQLAVAILTVGAILGIVGKKWLEQAKPKDMDAFVGRIEDITTR